VSESQGCAETSVRQLCLSADLIPRTYLEDLRGQSRQSTQVAVPVVSMTPGRREELIEKLGQAMADSEECPVSHNASYVKSSSCMQVCFDIISDPRITDCGHCC